MNIDGVQIPCIIATHFLIKSQLWVKVAPATNGAAIVYHSLATPVLGIAIPVFVLAASTAIVPVLPSAEHAAPLAYKGGRLGTLVRTRPLNQGRVDGLHAPITSIGGAGTFNDIFATSIVAVLLANLPKSARPGHPSSGPQECKRAYGISASTNSLFRLNVAG